MAVQEVEGGLTVAVHDGACSEKKTIQFINDQNLKLAGLKTRYE